MLIKWNGDPMSYKGVRYHLWNGDSMPTNHKMQLSFYLTKITIRHTFTENSI